MLKEEIKQEIGKVLDNFSETALMDLLAFLKELDFKNQPGNSLLYKILSEDEELLFKLAQ